MAINLFLYLIKFKKETKANRIFTVYLLLMSLVQFSALYVGSIGYKNLFLSHFYFIFQFLLLSLFYKQILSGRIQKKVVIVSMIVCSMTLALQYILDFSQFDKFNLLEIFITSFPIIVYALFHFYNILNESKKFYYINLGVFGYLFGSTFLFLCGNLTIGLNLSLEWFTMIWLLNSFLYIYYQIFILIEWIRTHLLKFQNDTATIG